MKLLSSNIGRMMWYSQKEVCYKINLVIFPDHVLIMTIYDIWQIGTWQLTLDLLKFDLLTQWLWFELNMHAFDWLECNLPWEQVQGLFNSHSWTLNDKSISLNPLDTEFSFLDQIWAKSTEIRIWVTKTTQPIQNQQTKQLTNTNYRTAPTKQNKMYKMQNNSQTQNTKRFQPNRTKCTRYKWQMTDSTNKTISRNRAQYNKTKQLDHNLTTQDQNNQHTTNSQKCSQTS